MKYRDNIALDLKCALKNIHAGKTKHLAPAEVIVLVV